MFEVRVQVHLNVNRHRCHKTLHNKIVETKHMLLYSYSPLYIAVRFDTQAVRIVILITRIYLRVMNIIRRIFYTVLNLLS